MPRVRAAVLLPAWVALAPGVVAWGAGGSNRRPRPTVLRGTPDGITTVECVGPQRSASPGFPF
jgi:hypothetical protein